MNVDLIIPEAESPPTPARRNEPTTARPDVLTFLAFVYASAIAIALALPGTIDNPGPAPLFTLFVPALAVALMFARRRSTLSAPLGFRRLGLTGWPAALVLPMVAVGGPYVLADLLGVLRLVNIGEYVSNAPFQICFLTLLFMGEEIGWRGFMLPRLATIMPSRRASLLTGFAQGVFHLPLILLTSSYDSAGNRAIIAPCVVLVLTFGGVMFGWLRTRTASLWPAAIAHGTVNWCIIEAPYLTSRDLDLAAYVAGEGGVLTLAGTALIAVAIHRFANWTPRHPR